MSDTEAIPSQETSSSTGLFLLTLMSIMVGISGVLGIPISVLAVMAVAAPGVIDQPAIALLCFTITSYPYICLIAIVAAWRARRQTNHRLAAKLVFLPSINFAVGLLAFLFILLFQRELLK